MTRVVLIRHGESVAQVESFIAGHDACRGLSDRGRQQVEALRDRLLVTGELEADVFLTSLMQRAVETASILAPALGGAEALQECGFCEIHPGEADGLTWDERDARYRAEPGWEWTPETVLSPGGETWTEFVARAGAALEEVVAEHAGKTIVIACHGGIVRASMIHFIGLAIDAANATMVFNASVTEWRFPAGPVDNGLEPARRWRLHRFNDHAHLAGTDLLPD